jgi:hypothetical protein
MCSLFQQQFSQFFVAVEDGGAHFFELYVQMFDEGLCVGLERQDHLGVIGFPIHDGVHTLH